MFHARVQHTALKASGQCHEVYATVKERVTGRIDTICASRTRFNEVYRCQDTPLEIRTLPGSGLRTRYFLLKYQGIQHTVMFIHWQFARFHCKECADHTSHLLIISGEAPEEM